MNKIFKVIWSKSKQCYVVVSEMAKNTTGKKKIVVASILAGLAMSTMGTHVMAVSTIPFTDKPSSALANGSVKNNTTNGVAIGNAAYSDSNQSIAIGFRSFASGTFLGGSIKPSVAVGAGAHAEGNNTVAIGTVAENRASYGVALGNESKVTSGSDYGIAIGYQTQVSAVHGMAIGEKASASGLIGMALGANAQATGAYSYAGGFNSASGGEAAIAVGKSASASGESAVAVGNGTVATGGDAVAIGTSSQATGGDSIALGKNANASNGDSIAIGQDTVSDKINSVALGKTSQATGASATALGPQAKATGSTAVAIGLNSEANQSATVAVGYNSAASGENAAAYGNTAKAVGKNSLALGANTQATVEGGVALGAGSIANTVAGAGYNPNTGRSNTFAGLTGNALTSTWAAVSIGDGTNTRQLTGLAAGINNTDAVNVAQLKSMNLAFTADGSTNGDVNLTNSALNVVGDSTYITTKGNNQTLTISGKKQNITVTNGTASASAGMADANNVAQAINQANADQTISYKANGGTANTVKVADGLNFTNGTSTVATVGANGQVTYDLNTTTKQSITDSSTAVNRTIALGSDSGSTTAKKLSTSAIAFNIKGDTGANALITTTATGDNVSITPTAKLTAAVAAAENAANKNLSNISSSGETVIKNLAKGAAQDAVKVAGTGLATVSDNTVGGVKTYTVDVNTGNLVVAANGQVGAAGTTGASGAAGSNGVATTQNVATAINDAVTKAKASTTQALADAEHKFDGDTGTTSVRKHGEVLTIKGGVANAADLTTGNIGVVSDGAGTLNIRLAKVLSGLTSATFTTAGGNTTVINSDGVTITPSGAGASAISMTTAGINAGNKEIKGVATGTTADAAVNKAQMDAAITAAAGGSLSTEKVVAKTLSGDTNLATVSGQTGTAKGETYEVAVSENAVKNVAKAAAQDAVTVTGTGLATVSDNTTGGVKTYTVDVNTGNLVVAANGQVGAAGTTGASGTAGSNGVATTQNVATAINDAITKSNANTAQALADAKHNFAGDDATVISRKHGEQLNIKGGASTTATDLTSGNIAVVGDTASGTLNIKMAKALTGLTSATYTDGSGNTQTVTGGSSTITDGAGNTTTITKGGVTTTDAAGNTTTTAPTGVIVTPAGAGATPISLTTSGISAGNKEIKNVANGTTDDAAVNKKQMDDALKGATDNTVSLGSESGTTTAKKLSTTGGIKFNIKGETGANALITTSATGDDVTIAPTAKLSAAVTAAEKSADKDLSNLSAAGDTYIKNLAKTAASWNVETNGGGTTTVAGGESVNFINGDNIAITNAGRAITIGTAKNVSFDKVTVGGVVLDKTDGINAGGKEVKGIADGTAADSAVSKGQMETAIANAQTAATSTEKVIAKSLTGDTNLATVTGQTGTAKGETYEVAVSENAVKNVAKAAAQDAVTVTGTGLATVSDNTTGGVKTYTVNVDEGKLVLDDTTGKIGANGATQGTTAGKNGVATTQNVATAINDAVTKAKASTTQALADAEHKFDGDTGTTSVRKHGEVLSIKGGVTTPADLATGNIGVVSDGAGTLNIRLAKVLSGLTSATFTTAGGNTTVINGDGVTITPSGAGASAISMTTDGINAGGKEVKGIADGTAADSAVSKGQMETAIANAQTAATSTEKVIAKALTGDTNLATVTGQTGTAKGETYEVAVSENAVKNVAKVAAQDAVTITGTGLATVSDNTVGGVKTYTVNVDEGKLVLDDTTGKIGANGATQGTTAGKNGVATTQNVATAINDAVAKAKASTTQALADAEHKFDGDTGATSVRKHGEVLSIKGGVTTPADLSTGNIGVVSDGAGTLNIRLAKVLSGLTSATFTDGSGNTQTVTGASSTITDGAGNTTAMTKGGLSTTDGTNTMTVAPAGVTATDGTNTVKLNGSGIDAGNTQIKNVGKATTDDAAVNKKQMDDAVKAATDATTALGNNTIALGSDAGSTTAKKLSTSAITFNIKGDTGANALITTSATGDDVTIAPTAKLTAAVTAAEKSADKDLSNISSAGKTVIKDLAATSAQDAVNVTGTGLATVSDNIAGGVKTYTVNVDEGKLVLDDTTGKIGANGATQGTTAGKNGVATTQNVATAINDAITKANANTAQALADAEHKFDGDTGATSVRKHGEVLSIKGGVTNAADLATGNIGVVSDGAGTLNIRLAKILSGLTSATFKDASGNTTMVTGGSTTIADTSGNTQTLAPTKSEIKDNNGVSTVTTKDGVTAKDASGQTTSLTKGGVNANDGNGNTTSLTNTGVSATDGNGHTTGLTNGGLSTTDGTNTTTVAPTGITATDGTNTVKLNGSGIDAGNTQIKNVGKATTDDAAVNKKQMDDAITKATADATHEFGGDDATVVSRKHGEKLTIKGGATTTDADLTSGNIAVIGDATNGALNIKLAKALTGLTSATYTDTAGNTTTVTGGSTTIADTSGNTQTLAPTKSEIKDNNGVSTVTTKDGVTAKDASGQTTSLTKGGVNATDGNGNTTSLTNTGVSATDGNGHTTGLTNGGLSTTDGTNTTTVAPTGITATDGTNTVKLNGSGIDAGNTEIKNVGKATTDDAAVNKKQMDDAITKATADATHEFGGDDATVVSRKHGEKLTIKGGASTSATDLTSGNIAVIGDTNGTLNLKLAKALTGLTSATFTDGNGNTQTVTGGSSTISDAAGNSTVVSKGGVTTTDAAGNSTTTTPTGVTVTPAGGTQISITTDGINAGGKEVKGIANGTTNDAAVNKGQMDAAVQNALDGTQALGNNTITLGGDTGSTDAKKLNTSGGIQFNIKGESGANALIRTTASGNTVSIASTDKLNNAVAAAENAANKDLSNLSANGESRIKDLAKSAASWSVQTNGGATTAVSGGDTVNFKDGKNIKITNTGREIKVATTDDVSFNKVTVGGVILDNNGMDAGNKEIKNVAAGTTANSAVNKQQLDNAISGVSNINYTTSSTTDRAGSTPVHSVSLSTGFNFKGDGNIQVTQDAANNGVIHYAMNPNLSGITSITGAGNGAPTMTFNSQNGNTPANVSINSNLDMGGHRITGVGPAEKPTDAVNKQQVDQALRGLTGMADNAARQYASKAGANAAALAALKPIQYDPLEPTQIMAGVGNYKSQTAVALGMAHYTNENTMFNIGVSLDSHDNMVNAGVTHKFGYSPEKKAIPDRYKGGPISSIYVMQDEMQALLAKDQEKDAVISKQASEIDILRQQNEDMQRKIDMILAKLQ
ncbi:YadA-like family protein [Veillonella atypica]|uniref:YadA-like family protein n=1 Tax=Veillonella atypica TaxID=39777 RepID=UPI00354B5F78